MGSFVNVAMVKRNANNESTDSMEEKYPFVGRGCAVARIYQDKEFLSRQD
jgi:hypothetical protein